jgi:hypothetical protein
MPEPAELSNESVGGSRSLRMSRELALYDAKQTRIPVGTTLARKGRWTYTREDGVYRTRGISCPGVRCAVWHACVEGVCGDDS